MDCQKDKEKDIERLKTFYRTELSTWVQTKSMKSKQGTQYDERLRNEIFVELTIGDWIDAHASDRAHFLQSTTRARHKVKMNKMLEMGKKKWF